MSLRALSSLCGDRGYLNSCRAVIARCGPFSADADDHPSVVFRIACSNGRTMPHVSSIAGRGSKQQCLSRLRRILSLVARLGAVWRARSRVCRASPPVATLSLADSITIVMTLKMGNQALGADIRLARVRRDREIVPCQHVVKQSHCAATSVESGATHVFAWSQ